MKIKPGIGITGGGTVIAGQILAPSGTGAAPSYSFSAQPGVGIFNAGGAVLVASGSAHIAFNYGGNSEIALWATGRIAWSSGSDPTTGLDSYLTRSAAGILKVTSGLVCDGPTQGLGYTTGAGGVVTQGSGSGKATTVVLNKVSGEITLDNAALNAGVIVSFTFTNSAIAATDVLILNHVTTGTFGSYLLNAHGMGAGSCTIDVRNTSAGNLSEAIVIRYAVIKAVTA